VTRGIQMAAEGADLIDVGGESTRPGASRVPLEDELARIVPVIRRLTRSVRVPISIDTAKAEVAAQALQAGAAIVNDVTALRGDPAMAAVIARHRAGVILMHMRGTPQTMQRRPRYGDVVEEIAAFLAQAARRARTAGIPRDRIFVDPGLGFGKTTAHNLALLRGLPRLAALGYPVVVGPSRKSFIGQVTGAEVHERLPGTLACLACAWQGGAAMVRVHDVKAAVQFFRMVRACGWA
jgi:dihydropteroate synthase